MYEYMNWSKIRVSPTLFRKLKRMAKLENKPMYKIGNKVIRAGLEYLA